MIRSGTANLPLHPGKAPRWLFKRMVALSEGIIEVMIYEYGTDELLRRLSDPFWFQALSCVLGYDWHSSGTTTVTCGALKEAVHIKNHGLFIAGGKGKASRSTLQEIEDYAISYNLPTSTVNSLQYASRMAAKIDNVALQDGYELYHHVIMFTEHGRWVVIQQGMNEQLLYARRYHWLSDKISDFICEPHNGIIGSYKHDIVLDMTARDSESARRLSVDLVNDNPSHLMRDWAMLTRSVSQTMLDQWINDVATGDRIRQPCLNMPRIINWCKMREIYEFQPKNYEELLSLRGVGPSTVRALALISDLIYGEKPSWRDPVKYTFTVGGKDGVPYPVDRRVMDETISIIKQGVENAKIGDKEKLSAFRRLKKIIPLNEF
ncbi:MAG: DUF763 domain-containing protein [Candidatus Thermoplasmatota archaeon]